MAAFLVVESKIINPDLKSVGRWTRLFYRDSSLKILEIDDTGPRQAVEFPWSAQIIDRLSGVAPARAGERLIQSAPHPAHHRGRVALSVREAGGEPPIIDSIAWIWRGRPKAQGASLHRLLIVIAFGLSLPPFHLQAGENDSTMDTFHLAGWVSAGLGGCYFGATGYASLSFAVDRNIFSVRYIGAGEINFNPGGANYDRPQLNVGEMGILYGRSYRQDFVLMSFSGGVGYISGVDRGKKITEKVYERVEISAIGIPFEAKIRFELAFVGIGFTWFGNINSQKIVSGGLLEISLGVF
jgi:hypothetical protein